MPESRESGGPPDPREDLERRAALEASGYWLPPDWPVASRGPDPRRRIFSVPVVVGVLLLTVILGSSFVKLVVIGRQAAPARPLAVVPLTFRNTTDGIHLGLAFDYRSATEASALEASVDYVFGGYFVDWDTGFYPTVKHIDAYLPFDTDAYPQDVPGHSLADWKAAHPDWIVYQCDRTTPAYYGAGNTSVPLDFSNPAVRAFEAREAATAFAEGADGVTFDNFTFANFEDRCGVYRDGVWTPLGYPRRWQDNAKYQSDMVSWLADMRAMLRQQFPTKSLGLNMDFSVSGADDLYLVAPYVDMIFDEAGFTGYGSTKLSDLAWQQEVARIEYLNSLGKAVDVNGIVPAPDSAAVTSDWINWVLGNYLLVKGAYTYTYIYAGNHAGFTGSPSGYGTFYDRPQYHIPIGHPTSNRFQSSGVQMRYYSGGLVIVNPSSSQTFTVPLGQNYRDMFGHTYATTVTLPPTTAIVLLSS